MESFIQRIYRMLPWFKGKLRVGKLLFFKKQLLSKEPTTFRAHYGLLYTIPNTIENIGVELMINGVYEREIVAFLCEKITGKMVFFDIGANIGSVALPVLKKSPDVAYFGFEASPMVFSYLEQNFRQNQIRNYQLVNKLVAKDEGETMKFYQAEQYGKSSMAPTYTHVSITVTSISIDQFCADHHLDIIHWMKIDVQGFELYVFQGMVDMLKKKKILNILFEFEGWADEQAGLTPGVAQRYLQEQGYTLYGLDGLLLEVSANKDDTMIWAKPSQQG